MIKTGEKLEKGNYQLVSMYRPFTKKYLYYYAPMIHRQGKYKNLTPDNKIIYLTGPSARREFSALVTTGVPDAHLMDTGQAFPLLSLSNSDGLLSFENENINKEYLRKFQLNSVEEVFYYVYGVLNSKEYKNKYVSDLKSDFPKIPLLKQKEKFITVGKALVDLHLNYENIEPFSGVGFEGKTNPSYKVNKMKHPKKGVLDKIVFNNDITITNIPVKAYEYVVNGRPAIEWIIDQYQVKTDKKSGIVDDPNLYSDNERYILDLLLRIINVSVQTVNLVNSLPPMEIDILD